MNFCFRIGPLEHFPSIFLFASKKSIGLVPPWTEVRGKFMLLWLRKCPVRFIFSSLLYPNLSKSISSCCRAKVLIPGGGISSQDLQKMIRMVKHRFFPHYQQPKQISLLDSFNAAEKRLPPSIQSELRFTFICIWPMQSKAFVRK